MGNSHRPTQVAIVDSDAVAASLLFSILRSIGPYDVWRNSSDAQAWQSLRTMTPDLFFVELAGTRVHGPTFTSLLRRSDLACRKAPVIVLASEPTALAVRQARDAGVHEFLCRPFTVQDVIHRLEEVARRQRDWIEAIQYIGPDRRRAHSAEFSGARKRLLDSHDASSGSARVGQALKIMKVAAQAIETEPRQALRSLLAQADDMEAASVETCDWAAAAAAKDFRTYLVSEAAKGRFSSEQLMEHTANLEAFQPSAANGGAKMHA